MIKSRTDEKLLLKYMRDISHARSKKELEDIDNTVTYDDDVSTTGYAILMIAIQIREEALK